jgi:two-component system, OmpR family, copper resistance phosphate regulon response regulator CusR
VALVMIVVDEPDTLLGWCRALEAAGHHVVLAADADTARERLAVRSIDVVVLDVMMPVRDGWSVLEALAALPTAPPVIVASRRAGPGDWLRATGLGAAAELPASFTTNDLLGAVAALVGRPAV